MPAAALGFVIQHKSLILSYEKLYEYWMPFDPKITSFIKPAYKPMIPCTMLTTLEDNAHQFFIFLSSHIYLQL